MRSNCEIQQDSPLAQRGLEERVARRLRAGDRVELKLSVAPPDFVMTGQSWRLQLVPNRRRVLMRSRGLRYDGPEGLRASAFNRAADPDGYTSVAWLDGDHGAAVLDRASRALNWSGRGQTAPVGDLLEEQEDELIVEGPSSDEDPAPAGSLAQFGVDLVREARAGRLTPPLHRDDAKTAVKRILCKLTKPSVALVGPAGIGKTAIVEGVAIDIANGCVPPPLENARLYSVNLGFMAAGASHQNEFEGRMKGLLDEARDRPDVILVFDELHLITDHRSDASQMIKEDLGRGRIRCLGATTSREYRAMEEDRALARRFQRLVVPELQPEQAVEVLLGRIQELEQHHGIRIPPEIVRDAVHLGKRFAPDRVLPDVAIDLLDDACALATHDHLCNVEVP